MLCSYGQSNGANNAPDLDDPESDKMLNSHNGWYYFEKIHYWVLRIEKSQYGQWFLDFLARTGKVIILAPILVCGSFLKQSVHDKEMLC